jgi:hypothetical protein
MAATARVATVNLVSAFIAFSYVRRLSPEPSLSGTALLALHQRYVPYAALQQAFCCAAAMRHMHKLTD